MTARHVPADDAFFAEWAAKRTGERRSLERARAVGAELGVWRETPPVLVVVGSKGKGTAAVHAAATLSSATVPERGRAAHVGLVTSPGLRTNRERMRFDGAAITSAEYDREAARLTAARRRVASTSTGYLSPTGAYTITGASWAARRGADALVLEEGLGGRSDEVGLFDARVVAVMKVFYEHGDILGPTLEHVARDLIGVTGPGTSTIVTVEQEDEVMAIIEESAAASGAEVVVVGGSTASRAPLGLAQVTRLNATAGEVAARALAAELAWTVSDDGVTAALRTVLTPGRLSAFRLATGPVLVDGAISAEGVRFAVEAYRTLCREEGSGDDPGTVVASFPDTKDTAACFAELRGFGTVLPVRIDGYLSFARTEALFSQVHPVHEALARGLAAGSCLVVGTQSFVGIALDVLDVATETAYEPVSC